MSRCSSSFSAITFSAVVFPEPSRQYRIVTGSNSAAEDHSVNDLKRVKSIIAGPFLSHCKRIFLFLCRKCKFCQIDHLCLPLRSIFADSQPGFQVLIYDYLYLCSVTSLPGERFENLPFKMNYVYYSRYPPYGLAKICSTLVINNLLRNRSARIRSCFSEFYIYLKLCLLFF